MFHRMLHSSMHICLKKRLQRSENWRVDFHHCFRADAKRGCLDAGVIDGVDGIRDGNRPGQAENICWAVLHYASPRPRDRVRCPSAHEVPRIVSHGRIQQPYPSFLINEKIVEIPYNLVLWSSMSHQYQQLPMQFLLPRSSTLLL